MGMTWKGAIIIDTALPFGLRLAPMIFTAIVDATEWIVANTTRNRTIMHYLDDFLVVTAAEEYRGGHAWRILLETFEQLGCPVAWGFYAMSDIQGGLITTEKQ